MNRGMSLFPLILGAFKLREKLELRDQDSPRGRGLGPTEKNLFPVRSASQNSQNTPWRTSAGSRRHDLTTKHSIICHKIAEALSQQPIRPTGKLAASLVVACLLRLSRRHSHPKCRPAPHRGEDDVVSSYTTDAMPKAHPRTHL